MWFYKKEYFITKYDSLLWQTYSMTTWHQYCDCLTEKNAANMLYICESVILWSEVCHTWNPWHTAHIRLNFPKDNIAVMYGYTCAFAHGILLLSLLENTMCYRCLYSKDTTCVTIGNCKECYRCLHTWNTTNVTCGTINESCSCLHTWYSANVIGGNYKCML